MESGKFETPVFVYDLDTVKNQLQKIKEAFGEARIFYSYKTNPRLGKVTHSMGLGLQVTSPQHLAEVLNFTSGKDVIYNGKVLDNKTLEWLVSNNVHIVMNSISQVQSIKEIDPGLAIGIRVDSKIVPENAMFTSSGKGLGISLDDVNGLEANIVGIHNHIASQNVNVRAYKENAKQLIGLAKQLNVDYINIGGGFPISYGEDVPPISEYARAFNSWDRKLYLEAGRFLVGPAGELSVEVIEVDGNIAVIDTSVFVSVRDRILSNYQIQLPIREQGNIHYNIVGNTPCSVDQFGEYFLERLQKRSRLTFLQAGAYCRTNDDFCGEKPPREIVKNE